MTASAGPVLEGLHREFGDRVAFLTLDVREAHPGDHYPQPESFEEKLEYAGAYRERVLREGLGQAAAGQLGVLGERERRMVPMMTGTGKMYGILSLAGPVARWDVARKLPPMYGLARLAAAFRPLSPFARSMAAMTVAMAAVLLLVAVVVVLV